MRHAVVTVTWEESEADVVGKRHGQGHVRADSPADLGAALAVLLEAVKRNVPDLPADYLTASDALARVLSRELSMSPVASDPGGRAH
jgi:hypothetical protein